MDKLIVGNANVIITPTNSVLEDIDFNKKCEALRNVLDALHKRVEEKFKENNGRKAKKNAHIPFPKFETGDYVLCCNPAETPTRKQSYCWHGPFQIVDAHNEYSFRILMIGS